MLQDGKMSSQEQEDAIEAYARALLAQGDTKAASDMFQRAEKIRTRNRERSGSTSRRSLSPSVMDREGSLGAQSPGRIVLPPSSAAGVLGNYRNIGPRGMTPEAIRLSLSSPSAHSDIPSIDSSRHRLHLSEDAFLFRDDLGSPVLTAHPTPVRSRVRSVEPRRIDQFFPPVLSPVVDGLRYASRIREAHNLQSQEAEAHSLQSQEAEEDAASTQRGDASGWGWKVLGLLEEDKAMMPPPSHPAASSTPPGGDATRNRLTGVVDTPPRGGRDAIIAFGMAPSPVFIDGLDLTEGTSESLPPSPPKGRKRHASLTCSPGRPHGTSGERPATASPPPSPTTAASAAPPHLSPPAPPSCDPSHPHPLSAAALIPRRDPSLLTKSSPPPATSTLPPPGLDCATMWDGAYDRALGLQARRAASQGLPPGYSAHVSNTHNRIFYKEASTGKTTWHRPAGAEAASPEAGSQNLSTGEGNCDWSGKGREEEEEEEGEDRLRASTPPVPGLQAGDSAPPSSGPCLAGGDMLMCDAMSASGREALPLIGAYHAMGGQSMVDYCEVPTPKGIARRGGMGGSGLRPGKRTPQYPPSSTVRSREASPCSADLSQTNTEPGQLTGSGASPGGGAEWGGEGSFVFVESASVGCSDTNLAAKEGGRQQRHSDAIMTAMMRGGVQPHEDGKPYTVHHPPSPSSARGPYPKAGVRAFTAVTCVWACVLVCVGGGWGGVGGERAGACGQEETRLWAWGLAEAGLMLALWGGLAGAAWRRRGGRVATRDWHVAERCVGGVMATLCSAWLAVGLAWAYSDYAILKGCATVGGAYAAATGVVALSFISLTACAVMGCTAYAVKRRAGGAPRALLGLASDGGPTPRSAAPSNHSIQKTPCGRVGSKGILEHCLPSAAQMSNVSDRAVLDEDQSPARGLTQHDGAPGVHGQLVFDDRSDMPSVVNLMHPGPLLHPTPRGMNDSYILGGGANTSNTSFSCNNAARSPAPASARSPLSGL